MTRTSYARLHAALGVVLLSCAANSGVVQAQEEEIDREPEKCVLVNRIARNVAASNQTVVFFMRGNAAYRNDLLQTCQALNAGDSRLVLNYRTVSAKISRLCDDSTFTVESRPGIACQLGAFKPITMAEARALIGEPEPAGAASAPAAAAPARPAAAAPASSDDDGRRRRRDRD